MYQYLFFGAGAGRNQAFIGGAGADIFDLEPEPKKNIWSRSRGKRARRRNTGRKILNLPDQNYIARPENFYRMFFLLKSAKKTIEKLFFESSKICFLVFESLGRIQIRDIKMLSLEQSPI